MCGYGFHPVENLVLPRNRQSLCSWHASCGVCDGQVPCRTCCSIWAREEPSSPMAWTMACVTTCKKCIAQKWFWSAANGRCLPVVN